MAPGDVSVAVFDPAEDGPVEGEAARIACWDFPVEATAELFRTDGRRKALFLEAPWPEGVVPKHDKLHLFVRYTTADGRNLQAEQPIEVALPGRRKIRSRAATSWTNVNRLAAEEDVSAAPTDQSNAKPSSSSTLDSPRTASREPDAPLERPVWKPERH
jgi:hypothetical protein